MRLANRFNTPAYDGRTEPTEIRRRGSVAAKSLLIWILIIATVLRLASALYQGNTVTDLPGIYDQISYDGLARRVVAGHGFSFAEGHWPATRAGEPTAHWSYLYTLYLAAVYAVVGVQPVIARLLQAVIAGLLHPWLSWRIGRRLFGDRVGLIAAALSAVYIYFVYYAGGLLTETFYFIGILWTVDVATRMVFHFFDNTDRNMGDYVPLRLWIELGLAVGVTGILRQVFLLFAPFLFLWIWWNRPELASTPSQLRRTVRLRTIGGLAVVALVVALVITPWTIRNYRAFHTFAPLNTNAGFAFFWGNHPIYGTHFTPLLGTQQYIELIPQELLHLNEAELDRALLKQAFGFIADDPVRYVLLSIDRSREYFKFWPSANSSTVSNIARVGSFALFLPFMLYGLWLSIHLLRRPEHESQRASIILLYLFMAIYSGIHLATWTLIRYRLPVDTILLLFAALAGVDIATRLGFLSQRVD